MSPKSPPDTNHPHVDMADVFTPFQHHRQHNSSKRKRNLDDHGHDLFIHDSKRPSLRTLPFRFSPSKPLINIPSSYPTFTSVYQQPPTPGDTSSEDESIDPQPNNATKFTTSPPPPPPPLLKVHSDHTQDVDMDLDGSAPVQPRIRRARSNHIMSPRCDPNFLAAIDNLGRDRVPTPISSHFDSRLASLPSAPRHQFPPLRTNLSPMFEQDSWLARDGLPSPVEDEEMEEVMIDDGVNVDQSESCPDGIRQFDDNGNSSPGRSRPARLHMGFLSGCEKCIQRVPGHYSHILRS